jgi:phosphatidylserine/phosphatidylglycerophosphate/cardiolipin synthase-like enzyme
MRSHLSRTFRTAACTGALLAAFHAPARADQLCDPAFQDCRALLVNLIRSEPTGIDVAFWFMKDPIYSTELIQRFRAGVRVRVLIDTDANVEYPENVDRLAELQAAGIPMRERVGSGILHWKTMIRRSSSPVRTGAPTSGD